MQEQFGLSLEQASAIIGNLDSIRGCISWIAFIETGDGSIRVRLRSRFVTVSELAEKYNGGGHACAAGATVYSVAEMKKFTVRAMIYGSLTLMGNGGNRNTVAEKFRRKLEEEFA